MSSSDDLPSCGASTRGSIRLLPVAVNSALRRDAFIICADLENGKFQWIEVMTNGRIPTNGKLIAFCKTDSLAQIIYICLTELPNN